MDIQVSSQEEMCDLMCNNVIPEKYAMPEEYQFCKRCGRKLKSKESRRIGYGKICFEKLKHRCQKGLLYK